MVSCINIGSRTYSAEGLKSPNVLEPDSVRISVATHAIIGFSYVQPLQSLWLSFLRLFVYIHI